METITVFANSVEQTRALKAFLKALKMSYIPTPQSELDKLESKLTPLQKKRWLELKSSITDIHQNKTTDSIELNDFLTELENEDKVGSHIPARV